MSPPSVIVVIDDDAALCDLLSTLLTAPGRVVEAVPGAAGLTAELLALSRPRLVLMNPRIAGVSLDELRELVLVVRELTQARFVLMVSEADRHADLPHQLGADREVPISFLLRDPLKALALTPEPVPEAPNATDTKTVSSMSPDEILSMDLGEGTWSRAPMRPASTGSAALRSSSVATDLATLIDDELESPTLAKSHHFDITLDTVSDHNLVVDAWKQIEGLFISTLFPPRVGDHLHLRVTFPWGAVAEVTGVASWAAAETFRRKRTGVGVSVEITEEFRKLAQRFLALRQPTLRPA